MVDAANRGWRDSNGCLIKVTVEKKILSALNAKIGIERNYYHYQSRLKWYKTRYANYSNLLRYSSGFGWDPVSKKFTAPAEVWETYLKAHPNHRNFRSDSFNDYEDLRIAVGNGTAIGRNAIGLGDDTDARTYKEEESRVPTSLDDLVFDHDVGSFVQNDTQDSLYESSSYCHDTSTLHIPPLTQEIPPTTKKRSRSDIEGKSTSNETTNQLNIMSKLTYSVDKLTEAIKSFDITEGNCWKIIKEMPGLQKEQRFKALKLLNTRAKKMEFFDMTPEDRFDWIAYELGLES
ncbi:hypothetical protein M5689_003598 [Euphorbia peplus]|nr:hypothetical protein M5689_003598 [Euphorbia peplus]